MIPSSLVLDIKDSSIKMFNTCPSTKYYRDPTSARGRVVEYEARQAAAETQVMDLPGPLEGP